MSANSKAPEKRKTGRPKGLPKTGGRQKGTPNRKSLKFREMVAEREGFDVVSEYMRLYWQIETTTEQRLRILDTLTKYSYPALKQIEDTEDEAIDVTPDVSDMSSEDLIKLAASPKDKDPN